MLPHTAQTTSSYSVGQEWSPSLYRNFFWLVTTLIFLIPFYMMAKVMYTCITLKFIWLN